MIYKLYAHATVETAIEVEADSLDEAFDLVEMPDFPFVDGFYVGDFEVAYREAEIRYGDES